MNVRILAAGTQKSYIHGEIYSPTGEHKNLSGGTKYYFPAMEIGSVSCKSFYSPSDRNSSQIYTPTSGKYLVGESNTISADDYNERSGGSNITYSQGHTRTVIVFRVS